MILPGTTRLSTAFLVTALACGATPGRAQVVDSTLWVTNEAVYAIARAGNTVYLGGDFTIVGPMTGGGAPVSTTTGATLPPFALVSGSVYAVAPDGAGGWYIGGSFSAVSGLPRQNLARVLANGSVSSWNPGADGPVYALAADGGKVYAGGQFSTLAGHPRTNLGAVDAVTGAADTWDPHAHGYIVYALLADGSTLFVGGDFDSLGGQPRSSLGAFDLATASLSAFDAHADDSWSEAPPIYALARSGGVLYVGGGFLEIGGQPRSYLAALDATTGSATAWNPGANNYARAIAVSGSAVYVGGGFSTVGGEARQYIAAIDAASGATLPWNPSADYWVYALTVADDKVYAGGDFSSIGGQPRNRVAALSVATGAADAWDASASGSVRVLGVNGSTLYVGGLFTSLGCVSRYGLAALDATSGAATSWNPGANGRVNALLPVGGTVYVGGEFSTLGGQLRSNIGAIDSATGLVTSWHPNAAGPVHAFVASGNTLFVAGDFGTLGGQARNSLGAFDLTSGNLTAFDAHAAGPYAYSPPIYALAMSGGALFAGGGFTGIGGQSRNLVAAIDPLTGVALPWNSNAGPFYEAAVLTLAVSGNTLYAGGLFGQLGGEPRGCLAALDATTGKATAWNPGVDWVVTAVAVSGNQVLVGGDFDRIGTAWQSHFAALDATTGAVDPWNPGPTGEVIAFAVTSGKVYAGGYFERFGGQPRSHLAAFSASAMQASVGPEESVLRLSLPFPNPSKDDVCIAFTLPAGDHVTLDVYDLQGRRIVSLLDREPMSAGPHAVMLGTADWAASSYFCRLRVAQEVKTRKFIVVK